MHKRNILIATLIWSSFISLLITFIPQLSHIHALAIFYFPSIVLSILFSGGEPMPSVLSGWSAFIIYTLSYWILLLIGYALLLEIYLFHKSSHYLDDAVDLIATNPEQNKDKALEKIGNMIAELEAKRRSHFLLQNLDEDIDINLKPQQLAVHCCTKKQQIKPVKKVLTKLHIKLQKRIGEEKATKIMDDLFPVKNYS